MDRLSRAIQASKQEEIEALRKERDECVRRATDMSQHLGKRIKELERALDDWLEYYNFKPPEHCAPIQGWVDAEGEVFAFCTARANILHTKQLLEKRDE